MIFFFKKIGLLFFFFSCFLLDGKEKKIVALLQVRNEEAVIEQSLRMLAIYADKIVVLDDASEDNTVLIMKELSQELKIAEIIENKVSAWENSNEKINRQKLFSAGRRVGGTHFILLDADEIFTANCTNHDWLRKKILSLLPGQVLLLPTIHPWDSLDRYRNDEIINPFMKRWLRGYIFADDKKATYLNARNSNDSNCVHVSRIPLLRCKERKRLIRVYALHYSVIHFKCVDLENIELKKAWYMCLELIRSNEKKDFTLENRFLNANIINKNYKAIYSGMDSSYKFDDVDFKSINDNWYKYDFFDCNSYCIPDQLKIDQIINWFSIYGVDYFKDLDIWDIKTIKNIKNNVIKTNIHT